MSKPNPDQPSPTLLTITVYGSPECLMGSLVEFVQPVARSEGGGILVAALVHMLNAQLRGDSVDVTGVL